MSKEGISVIVTTYNQRDEVCNAIDSIISQTWNDLEIIIVDDASTDDILHVLEKAYGELDNLMLIVNDERIGFPASRNLAVSYAAGEYIAFLNGDMIWKPDKLEKQMNAIQSSQSGGNAVYCSYACLYQEDAKEFPEEDVPLVCRSGDIFPYSLIRPLIDINTLLIRKEVFEHVGDFDTQLQALWEYEFSLRLAQYGAVDYIPEILVVTHQKQRDENASMSAKEIMTQCSIVAEYYDDLLQFGLVDKKLDLLYKNIHERRRDVYFQCLSLIDRKEVQAFLREKRESLDISNRPQILSVSNISQVQDCVGCMSCYAACGQGAIIPEYDQEGFLHPNIISASCIHCGKCIDACPLCNLIKGTKNPEYCYAVKASDEIRMKCSSGGVFPVLAEYVLQQGGWVAGVVFTEEFLAQHIVSNQKTDVERMFSSKYLQSDMGGVYKEIKELLEGNELVLFSGCACQVAALHAFLGQQEYPKLLTVDVVCHGVPSQKVWEGWLSEQQEIDTISFRDKTALGWTSGLCVNYRNGECRVDRNMEDPYMFAFLNNWILRESCYDCHFKKQKYSDITLGDFWGIQAYVASDDNMGTSFVTENTRKGSQFFRKVKNNWKFFASIQTGAATKFNPCINSSERKPKYRQIFFDNWNRNSLVQSINDTRKKVHFDIALALLWSQNYGNALTNYALYTHLQREGYRVLALDNYSPLRPTGILGEFAKASYQLSSDYFQEGDRALLNDRCDCFMVGSDQCWNSSCQLDWKCGDYFYLDFVQEGKKKLSFGSSFGQPEEAVSPERGIPFFQSFDAVSVREEFGVALCEERYGVEAQKVVDPVFLLDKEEYTAVASRADCQEKEPFIMVYILNPTEEKRKLCKQIQERLDGIKLVNVLDCDPLNEDYNRIMMEFDYIKCHIPLENWLYYMQHCRYVITDSFHGTCFSIIFNKPFVTIKNRQKFRFATFEKYKALSGRIVEEDSTWNIEEWITDIDYAAMQEPLKQEIEKSKDFLKKNLRSG